MHKITSYDLDTESMIVSTLKREKSDDKPPT